MMKMIMRKITAIFVLIQCLIASYTDRTIELETPSCNGEHTAADNANTRVPYQSKWYFLI